MARVVGNVVSTIKDKGHEGLKLMVVRYINQDGAYISNELICTDAADAGIGDVVLVNTDGGAGQMLLDNTDIIIDCVIAGVIDHISVGGIDQTLDKEVIMNRGKNGY